MATIDYDSNKVKFQWNYEGDKVEVAGNFQLPDMKDWSPIALDYDQYSGKHSRQLSLKPDIDYAFKFVVDGNWCYDQSFPNETDGSGNTNNVFKFEPRAIERENDLEHLESKDLNLTEIIEREKPALVEEADSDGSALSETQIPEVEFERQPELETKQVESILGLNLNSESPANLEDKREAEHIQESFYRNNTYKSVKSESSYTPPYESELTSKYHYNDGSSYVEGSNYFDEGVVLGEFTPPTKSKNIEVSEAEAAQELETEKSTENVELGQESKEYLESPVVEAKEVKKQENLAINALQTKRKQRNAGKAFELTTFELVTGFSVLAAGLTVAAISHLWNKYVFNKRPLTKSSKS